MFIQERPRRRPFRARYVVSPDLRKVLPLLVKAFCILPIVCMSSIRKGVWCVLGFVYCPVLPFDYVEVMHLLHSYGLHGMTGTEGAFG